MDLSTRRFLAEYEDTSISVLIKGATRSWPAVQKWSAEYLAREAGGAMFRATSGVAPLPAACTMARYARYCEKSGGMGTEEAPLYLFDRDFRKSCPGLVDDYMDAVRESCPYFYRGGARARFLFATGGGGEAGLQLDYCRS